MVIQSHKCTEGGGGGGGGDTYNGKQKVSLLDPCMGALVYKDYFALLFKWVIWLMINCVRSLSPYIPETQEFLDWKCVQPLCNHQVGSAYLTHLHENTKTQDK